MKQWFQIDRLTVKTIQTSQDGTKKFLFELTDGNLIETVLMHHDYGNSVCITSQVGCNMGCAFCASGMKKKKRNLEAYEMVLQVLSVSMLETKRISHVVVMGIGEPFDNYDNVLKFLRSSIIRLGLRSALAISPFPPAGSLSGFTNTPRLICKLIWQSVCMLQTIH